MPPPVYTLAGDAFGKDIELVSVIGLESRAARRGSIARIPYRQGGYTSPDKRYEPKTGSFLVRINDVGSGGLVVDPDGAWGHTQANLDEFYGRLHASTQLTILKTLADGSTQRRLFVEVLEAVAVDQLYDGLGILVADVTVEAAYPFWEAVDESTETWEGVTGSSNLETLTVAGNAPVDNGRVTVTANNNTGLTIITFNDAGSYTIAARDTNDIVVIDESDGTVVDGGGNPLAGVVTRSQGGMRLRPGSNDVVITAGGGGDVDVEIAWRNQWF